MEKIFSISLKLNFIPNTLSCYRLKKGGEGHGWKIQTLSESLCITRSFTWEYPKLVVSHGLTKRVQVLSVGFDTASQCPKYFYSLNSLAMMGLLVAVSPETTAANSRGRSPPKSPCVPDLPPRRVRRPRSPWHDVPTNNSPVYVPTDDEDLHGRRLHNMSTSNRSAVHEGPQWSPGASSDHLAIFLSSESSDDEFHEEQVVLRQPLDLPNADPQGHVGLSRIEAAKLSLLLRAHEAGSAATKRNSRPDKEDVCGDVDAIIARLEASSAATQSAFRPPLPEKRPVLRAQSFHVVPTSSFCPEKRSTPDLRPQVENEIVVHEQLRPPALPAKVRRSGAHSRELDALLAQLTDMTQVPLRPAAGTRSLEERSVSSPLKQPENFSKTKYLFLVFRPVNLITISLDHTRRFCNS